METSVNILKELFLELWKADHLKTKEFSSLWQMITMNIISTSFLNY